MIGKGAFGVVYLVKIKDSPEDNNCYALKVLKKKTLKEKKMYEYALLEKNILA
jgi:serine/threonine protein kinase